MVTSLEQARNNAECQAIFSSEGEESGLQGRRVGMMETAGAIENQMRQTWMQNVMNNEDKLKNI